MKFKGYLFLLMFSAVTYSQVDSTLILGNSQRNNGGSVFDLSDPTGVNMEVNLWGYIRYPGRYRVPVNTTFMDLISFAGGPIEESNLEEIRIFRSAGNQNQKQELIKLNYNDILWGENVSSKPKLNPVLLPGDVIVILQEKRYTFKENLGFYLPILTTLVAIATFIITIYK